MVGGSPGGSGVTMADLLVICTRNRPVDIEAALSRAAAGTDTPDLLVVDASDPVTALNVREIASRHLARYIPHEPGLALQRNSALAFAKSKQYNIIHFIDDDTLIDREYIREVRAAFARDSSLAGVGGVVTNQPRPKLRGIKRFFLLDGRIPGQVLRSGRNVIGHYPEDPADAPEWLPGCCMSYQLKMTRGLQFDSRLQGYSWGEDFDFGFRLSRTERLRIEPRARVVHTESPVSRLSSRVLAAQRTVRLYRWVDEHQALGMSRVAWGWSVLGELVMRAGSGVFARNPNDLSTALGVLGGVGSICRSELARWSRLSFLAPPSAGLRPSGMGRERGG